MQSLTIFEYSRKQAIDDGVLADVSTLAREMGFRYPVALTAAAHEAVTKDKAAFMTEDGRIWDCLINLRVAIKNAKDPGDRLPFSMLIHDDKRKKRMITLFSIVGPGDDLEPVITVMMEGES